MKRRNRKELNVSKISEKDCKTEGMKRQQERTQRLEDLWERAQDRRNEGTQQERSECLEDFRERTQDRRNEETGDESTRRLAEQRAKDTTRWNAWLARRNLSADVGEMSKVYPQYRAYHFSGETGNFCRTKGKVNITPLQALPDDLINLYTSDTPQSNKFRKNIRQYNWRYSSFFQLMSFDAKAWMEFFNDHTRTDSSLPWHVDVWPTSKVNSCRSIAWTPKIALNCEWVYCEMQVFKGKLFKC